jgi:glycosyltransferase involved in cell wall biosynthesis
MELTHAQHTPQPVSPAAPYSAPQFPPRRVAFLLNNEFRFDNRVRREAETLADAGLEVTVLCVADTSLPSHETRHTARGRTWWVHRCFGRRLHRERLLSSRAWRAVAAMVWHYRSTPFDIVHAHDANTLLPGWLLSRLWRAPLVYDSHEYWHALFQEQVDILSARVGELPPKELNKRLGWAQQADRLEPWLMVRAHQVITVGHAIAERLHQRMAQGLPPGVVAPPPVHVVMNAWEYVPDEALAPAGAAAPPRLFHEAYALPRETRVMVYQGQIAEKRGLGRLVDAMAAYAEIHGVPPLALVMMGPVLPGDQAFYATLCTRIAQDATLKNRVFLKPAVPPEALLRWTASADLGVHPILNTGPNHYFCMPNKIFEYLQAGLPMATSNFPEMQAIVDTYGLGFTFDPEQPAALAQQLAGLFAQPQRLETYRAQVRRAKQSLSWEAQVPMLLTVYQNVLRQQAV